MCERDRFELCYFRIMGTPTSVLKNLRDGQQYRYTEGDRLDIAWQCWVESMNGISVIEQQVNSGWIKCSEQLPEVDGRYWCYVAELNCSGLNHYQLSCSWSGEKWTDPALSGTVTHWQPLPEPPQ